MSNNLDYLCEELSRETGTAFRVIRHPGPPGRLSRYQIAGQPGRVLLVHMGYLPLKKEG